MITIKIRDWAVIGGITQVATSYQVAADSGFTNIVDDNPVDATNITAYYSPAIVPLNATYYVRVMRHFSDNTNSGWGEVLAVTNTQPNGGLLAYDPIKVYQPVVIADPTILDINSTTYTLTSSQFVGVNEGHGYTVWVVLNDRGDVLEFAKSTIDLTSITFPKVLTKFLDTKYIKVLAIHGTLTGIESPAGVVTKNISNVGFNMSIPADNHAAGMDLYVTLNPTPNVANNVISKLVLKDVNGTELWTQPVINGVVDITVPGTLFIEDTQYLLSAYGIPADAAHTYTIGVFVRPAATLDRIDRSYKYSKTLRAGTSVEVSPVNTSFVTTELFNSKILLPVNGGIAHSIMNQDGSFSTPITPITGIAIGTTGTNSCLLRMLSKNRLLLDYATVGGSSTTIYNLDYYNNIAVVSSTLVNTGNDLGQNGGIVFTSENTYYTARVGDTSIYVNNILTNSITTTAIPLPINETAVVLITKDQNNNLLVFCKDASVVYRYDIDTGVYTDKYTLPLTFRGRTLKQQLLVNGDVLIWKPINTETVNGSPVSDTNIDMFYIDNVNSVVTTFIGITGVSYDIPSIILDNSGKLTLVTSAATGSNVVTFE